MENDHGAAATAAEGLPAVGELRDVVVEKLVYGGEGLARDGKLAVFVPFAAPGDRLRVRITEVRSNFARGAISAILAPAPARRPAPCPHFGMCGGCQLQHLDYTAQLAAKEQFIRESLARLGHIAWPGPIPMRAAAEFGYRSRAELRLARSADAAPQLGFFRAGTHDVCAIETCPLLLPSINHELAQVLHAAAELPADASRVIFTAGDDSVIVTPARGEGDSAAELDAQGTVRQTIGDTVYAFGARSFFQPNRRLVGELIAVALSDARGALAVDLYSGAGLFALHLARRFTTVHAVEGNAIAARHGAANARTNGLANVLQESRSVEAWFRRAAARLGRPDFVLLDPPRSGLGTALAGRLADLAPARIAYVSCDPTTLARDLHVLVARGYTLESVTGLDMFPQTYHVETVAHLSR